VVINVTEATNENAVEEIEVEDSDEDSDDDGEE
jgi:hypothetical protein